MKTYSAKPADIQRKWLLIDADGAVVGRLAAEISKILRGKHKAQYTPSMDCGDYVVVINAEKAALTGKKKEKKVYYRHTGFPGGIKEATAGKILSGRFPERVIEKAVERMITRNPMGRENMRKLYIYKGNQHPHAAQNPETYEFKKLNRKNAQ